MTAQQLQALNLATISKAKLLLYDGAVLRVAAGDTTPIALSTIDGSTTLVADDGDCRVDISGIIAIEVVKRAT